MDNENDNPTPKGDILVVDDKLENVRLLADMLTSNGYEARQVLSGKQALNVVNYDPPELILLDIMMPEMDGYEVCQELKANPATHDIPVIFVSAKITIYDKVKAFQVGGVDYITKPFFLAEVLCRIETHLNIYRYKIMLAQEIAAKERALAELDIAYSRLEAMVNIDGLTQIANRRRFDEYLEEEWNRSIREKLPLSLIMIDIDCFKLYNDFYGHLAGDDCLTQVAQAISDEVKRPADLVARYGGEEFIVLLPNTNSAGAIAVGEMIRGAIHRLSIPHERSTVNSHITLSLGVATIIPNSDLSPISLIDRADQALYQAKQKGRDRLCISQ